MDCQVILPSLQNAISYITKALNQSFFLLPFFIVEMGHFFSGVGHKYFLNFFMLFLRFLTRRPHIYCIISLNVVIALYLRLFFFLQRFREEQKEKKEDKWDAVGLHSGFDPFLPFR